MRQSAGGSISQRFQQQVSQKIATFGEDLTVTRPSDSTTRTVRFLPLPMRSDQASNLLSEGLWNLGEPMPHNFVCKIGSDVREKDFIGPYNGNTWRILTATPSRLNGSAVGIECMAVREK